MSKKGGLPDAWDDDWETIADKSEAKVAEPAPAPKLSKAQRRQQHLEQQKQLWDSAENPDRFHWLETQGVVPLKQELRPQMKLLSRKPVAPNIAKKNAADGMAGLNLEDDDNSEDEARKKRESELEERQRKAKLEREEKQKKYAEARERIMGTSNPVSPAAASRDNSHARENRRSRGKVNGSRNSQPNSSADQSPARQANGDRQLFDPEDMGRRAPNSESPNTPKDDQPARQPRGPESSGKGGFGFASRGGKAVS
ncbi:hypothetical protein LTR37_000576 [Vermiconidia calcicola]|uniref:Uncharacterized protein n=1 Tax=Vermiconidia calcicola TaxID=1690605 RepID=A0ACC3P0F0_9PEZI|nr:hypothetical protein LTR37_000576 [Vermiconidia calcicola]